MEAQGIAPCASEVCPDTAVQSLMSSPCCVSSITLKHVTQLWDGTWNSWPGQVPSNMSPLDSMSELKACLDTSPGEYEPRPLDESSAGLHSLATSFLMFRLSKEFEDVDPDQVSR